MEKYKLDITTDTLIVSKKFDEKSNNPTSEEYKILQVFKKDFPNLKIVKKTHKTPTTYHTKSGEIVKCNQYKYLTYENMETFIDGLPNNGAFKESFEFLKKHAVPAHSRKYVKVREWFEAQFPLYRNDPLYYYYNAVDVIDRMKFVDNDTEAIASIKKAS